MMACSQLIKSNGVNNTTMLLLKESNMYYPPITVPKQHHKHRSLTAAHLNDERVCINLWNRFYPGGKTVLFIKVKTFSAQRSAYQMSIRAMQMSFMNASCTDKWAVVIKDSVMIY